MASTCGNRRLAECVERTGADVAIDDTDTPQSQRQKPRRRFIAYMRGRRGLVCAFTHGTCRGPLKPGLISLHRAREYGTNGATDSSVKGSNCRAAAVLHASR